MLTDPADGLVGEVLGEVITVLGGFGRLDRRSSLVESRVVLVVLTADEPIEVLEPPPPDGQASNGPMGEDCQTGTSWHLPNCAVEYPFNLRLVATGAFVFGRRELLPGAAVASRVIAPIPTE